MHKSLQELLSYLDATLSQSAHHWHAWQITPVSGGANNLVYRATSDTEDYAVKFTIRDDRRRAQREYAALDALCKAGLALAPRAVWLDEQRYQQPCW